MARRCHAADIHFILSIFQEAALPLLDHCDAAKVASRAALTYPYDKVELPLIISDGMIDGGSGWITGQEYRDVDNQLPSGSYFWLHCQSTYPTPIKQAMEAAWTCDSDNTWGLSDHSGTPWPGLAAIACGSGMIEVHFSSEKTGRDAVVELTVDELKLLCDFRDAVAL